jgi:hypothetical protein
MQAMMANQSLRGLVKPQVECCEIRYACYHGGQARPTDGLPGRESEQVETKSRQRTRRVPSILLKVEKCDNKHRRKGVLRDHVLSKDRSNSRGASRLYRLQHAN